MVDINRQLTKVGIGEGGRIVSQIKINNVWCEITLPEVDIIEALFDAKKYTYRQKMNLLIKLSQNEINLNNIIKIFYPYFHFHTSGNDVIFHELLHTKLKGYHNISNAKVRQVR